MILYFETKMKKKTINKIKVVYRFLLRPKDGNTRIQSEEDS